MTIFWTKCRILLGCFACCLMLAWSSAFAADPSTGYLEAPASNSLEALYHFIQRPEMKSHVAAWGLGVSDIRTGIGRLSSTELTYLARTLEKHPEAHPSHPAADAMLVVMVSSLTRSMLFTRVISRHFGKLSLPAPLSDGDSIEVE